MQLGYAVTANEKQQIDAINLLYWPMNEKKKRLGLRVASMIVVVKGLIAFQFHVPLVKSTLAPLS